MRSKFMVYGLWFMVSLLVASPAYAAVNIGDKFGYGDITSFGQALSRLVVPVFSVATTAVVIFFLLGAFKYLKSGGNKEEVAGAQQMITQSIIGFMILVFIFLILPYLLFSLFGITGFQLF